MAAAELDGRPVVISGSDDWTVRVWDLATGTPVGDPFTGHTDEVTAVAAAELDGRPVVISGSHDRTVRVWDLATGTPVGDPFTAHTSPVYAVATAELDGRPVAISGSSDRTVRVWDLAKRNAKRYHFRRIRLRHAAPVHAEALIRLADCLNVITGCADSASQTWDLRAWRTLSRTITPGRSGVSAIVILTPDHVLYAISQAGSWMTRDNADSARFVRRTFAPAPVAQICHFCVHTSTSTVIDRAASVPAGKSVQARSSNSPARLVPVPQARQAFLAEFG